MGYKRVVITEFGGPEVLKMIEETKLPEPKSGEVRVKVLVTSAAFTDVWIRKGTYPDVKEKPPFSPGYDMVGVVDKLGEGVTHFQGGAAGSRPHSHWCIFGIHLSAGKPFNACARGSRSSRSSQPRTFVCHCISNATSGSKSEARSAHLDTWCRRSCRHSHAAIGQATGFGNVWHGFQVQT